MRINALLATVIISLCPQFAIADDFMLPNSFRAEIRELPPPTASHATTSMPCKPVAQVARQPQIKAQQPQQTQANTCTAPQPHVQSVRTASATKELLSPVKSIPVKTVVPAAKTVISAAKTVSNTISLTDLIRNYKYNYSKTLVSTLVTLEELNIDNVNYDSSKGQITASQTGGQEIFILLLPSQDNLTYVRITPADGQYSINRELVNNIFSHIEQNISEQLN